MFSDILKSNKCFKLVCGAGNEDIEEVEKLVYLYSKAGCNIFDLSANKDVIQAAKRGLKRSGITEDRYLCVSLGIAGDPHINKAEINENKCTKCDRCKNICPQSAITEDARSNYVKSKRCIGCGRCEKVCPHNAITMYSKGLDLKEVLPDIIKENIDCIELHALIENDIEVMDKWQLLNDMYDGFLSICIDRSKLSNEHLIKRLKQMLEIRKPYTTIIQADGAPMSGGKDDYKTTLQAVATAELVQDEDLPAFILLSGGTNSKTAELAKLCNIKASGVAIGSYARKIVKEYINRNDFYDNKEILNTAINVAKHLVDCSIFN